ncbi:TonB-dependent receptor domain-containing protein [Flavicella marina]|uniref:TonB-dependent receptor domain-containing protein n=1 Tax=Flavicella marina TaxID=1475951 RepID=UPI001264DC59|nr:TonB-dependent receptor [Flavicella marina]
MKFKFIPFIYFICVALSIQHLSAQKILNKIRVSVKDIETNQPIALAQVLLSSGKELGVTDAEGSIEIESMHEGKTYFVIFSYEYAILETQVEISSNNKEIIFKMTPLGEVLSEVELDNHKKEIFNLKRLKPVEGTAIYAGKKTEVVLVEQVIGGLATNNARQVMSQVVGMNIFDAGDGGLQLSVGGRGLDPNRTANFNTRQNGYDISADVLGYPESYYTPANEALSEIQVIRGAASLQYGTQFGGLINFKLKEPQINKEIELVSRNTVGSFGLYTNFTSVNGSIGKFSYYAYYNFKRGDGYRENSNFDSHNAFAHLEYRFNKKTKISFESTYLEYLAKQSGGLSDVQFLEDPRQSNRTRNWFAVNWNLLALKLEHKLTSKTELSLNVFGLNASRKAIGFIANYNFSEPNPFLDVDEQDNEGNFIHERDLLVGQFRNWGAEARLLTHYDINDRESVFLIGTKIYNANNTSQQGPGSKGTDADFNFYSDRYPEYPNQSSFNYPNFNTAVFGENIFNISDSFSITPGFRFEYIKTTSEGEYLDNTISEFVPDNRSFNRNIFLLGIGASYKPDNYFELYGNVSQNYRSVTFSDIRTTSPSFVVSEDITDEKGYTSDVGVRGKVGKNLSYDASVFGLLYLGKIGTNFTDRVGWERSNIGDAFIYGVESLFDFNLKNIFWENYKQIKNNVFINTAFTNSQYYKSELNGVEGKKVEFVPLVNLKTGTNFGYKNFMVGVQYTYLSEQYTDVTNAPYNPNNATSVEGAIPAYDILDLSFSYVYKKIRVETGVTNLLNNSYFTRRATGYPGPGIITSDPRGYYFTFEFKL